jgi:hypothetical protein
VVVTSAVAAVRRAVPRAAGVSVQVVTKVAVATE